jgi:tetratricopeptide (TPR) repeat protein
MVARARHLHISPDMKRLTLDEIRATLPELDELRPFFDHLLARSEPDRSRTWSGSGRLGTAGSRLVPDEAMSNDAVGSVAAAEAARLGELYACAAQALSALAAGERAAAAAALLEAAGLEEVRDRPGRAAAYASAAHRASRGERDQRPAALALRRWARACRALGELSEALELYVRSHEAASAMSDPRGAAEAAIGAGNVLEEQGRWAEAGKWYRHALDELGGIDEPTPERWHALLNLHIVTRSGGAIEESLGVLESAELAAAEVDPESARPFIENARGQLEMSRGAYAAAEGHFRRALDADTAARAHVSFRLNLAEALLAQGHSLDAAEHAREAEREAIQVGLVTKLPEAYRILGRIASAEGNVDAFVLFERALEIVRDRGLPGLEEALTLQSYAESEARRGDADTARQLQEKALERFADLGMAHMRQTWADVYGTPEPSEAHLPKEEDDHEA